MKGIQKPGIQGQAPLCLYDTRQREQILKKQAEQEVLKEQQHLQEEFLPPPA
jgi:hypothetical protein